MKNIKLRDLLSESKDPYVVYHNTYSSAVQAARKYAENKGYIIDEDDWASSITFGPRKPGKGKTSRASISLFKGEKLQKKALQIQVYNRGLQTGNTYELNAYIS